jgi:hypothetical protein
MALPHPDRVSQSGAYPIAGLEHEYQPPGYIDDHPFVLADTRDRHRSGGVPVRLRRGR